MHSVLFSGKWQNSEFWILHMTLFLFHDYLCSGSNFKAIRCVIKNVVNYMNLYLLCGEIDSTDKKYSSELNSTGHLILPKY